VSDRAPIPNLPPISSIKDPDVRVALESMWNAWRVRNGDVGDGEHKFLTAADLTDALTSTAVLRGGGGSLTNGSFTSGRPIPNTSWVRPLLNTIDDYIMQSWLWKKLEERIEWIETPEWFIDKLDRSVGTAIKNEEKIREAADSSLASSIKTVSAVLNGNIAQVQEELTANVTLTESTASHVTTLQSEFNTTTTQIRQSLTTLSNADQALTSQINQAISDYNGQIAGVKSEIRTVSNSVSALSQSTTTNFTNVNNNLSLIRTDVKSVTDLAGSNASKITTLQTSVSGVKTSAENALTLASTIDGNIRGAWTVKFDANGYVAGAGLSLEGKGGNIQSQFYVRADIFAIGNPAYPNVTPKIPFKVFTTTQNINGSNIPPGVYIDTAVIADGTIDNAKIGYAAVGSAEIQDLAVETLKIGNNAVTIPASQQSFDARNGNGGTQVINQISYYLPFAGSLLVIFNGRQNYDFGPRNTALALYLDGSEIVPMNIAGAINDYANVSWSGSLGAGWHTIQIVWHGQDGSVRISSRTLSVLGAMK
jgi:hypothetical protein